MFESSLLVFSLGVSVTTCIRSRHWRTRLTMNCFPFAKGRKCDCAFFRLLDLPKYYYYHMNKKWLTNALPVGPQSHSQANETVSDLSDQVDQ